MVGVMRENVKSPRPRSTRKRAVVVASEFDQYLATVPQAHQHALVRLRAAIIAVVPGAEEVTRRGAPAFRYRAKPLVSIGAAQRHVSWYVMYGDVLKMHARELEAHDVSSTVVHFDPTVPIPVRLVKAHRTWRSMTSPR